MQANALIREAHEAYSTRGAWLGGVTRDRAPAFEAPLGPSSEDDSAPVEAKAESAGITISADPTIRRVATTLPRPEGRFVPAHEWEGVVTEVDETRGVFAADLEEVGRGDVPREWAEFYIEDVRSDDRALLRVGAVFRWVIGKRQRPHGGIERSSQIVFRRLPMFTLKQKIEADRWAEQMMALVRVG